METGQTLLSWTPKSLQMLTAAMKLKDAYSWKKSYDKSRQSIKKQRHYFVNKVQIVKAIVFPVVMYECEFDRKEGWVSKNWCFPTVVLEKTLESPLDCTEIKPVNLKGNQSWIFIWRTNAEAKDPIHWPLFPTHWKRPWCWERQKAGGEGDNRGWDGWMASLTLDTSLSKLRGMVKDGEAWCWIHGVPKSWTQQSDWTNKAKESLSRVQLCDCIDWSPPGSSVHANSWVRILEWVAISFFKVYSWSRDQTMPPISRRILYISAHIPREAFWTCQVLLLCLFSCEHGKVAGNEVN